MQGDKKYGLQINFTKEYFHELTAVAIIFYLALQFTWSYTELFTVLVIEGTLVGFFGLLTIFLKTRAEDSRLKTLGHGLFFLGHYLLIHISALLAIVFAGDYLVAEFSLTGSFFQLSSIVSIVLLTLIKTMQFYVTTIREKAFLTTKYSLLHIRPYTHHIIVFGFTFSMIAAILEQYSLLSTTDYALNTQLVTAFFIARLFIDFFVYTVRLHPNSPKTNRRVIGESSY